MRYGLEIEVEFPDGKPGRWELQSFYDDEEWERRAARPVPYSWRMSFDGSLVDGWEIKSPILEWDLDTLYRVLARLSSRLQRHGATVSDRTGVHVHVDREQFYGRRGRLRWRAVRALLGSVANNEDILYRIAVGDSRRHRGTRYCMPLTDDIISSVWGGGLRALPYDHYYCLSFSGRWRTWEWRFWNGSLNPEVLTAYVAVSLGMTQHALATGRILPPFKRATALLRAIGVEARWLEGWYDFKEDKPRQAEECPDRVILRVCRDCGYIFPLNKEVRKSVQTCDGCGRR